MPEAIETLNDDQVQQAQPPVTDNGNTQAAPCTGCKKDGMSLKKHMTFQSILIGVILVGVAIIVVRTVFKPMIKAAVGS